MEEKYDFKKIEQKWQKKWEELTDRIEAKDFDSRPEFYNLVEFPYPSGSGLHVGHCMGYGASDAHVRMKRMQGYNVIFPIGWDAFGLPTENYAIKTGKKPAEVTKENTDYFRKQMKSLGYSFDWNREVNTTDPDYYKWTQWIFLQFYKHAYVDGKIVSVADDDKTTPRMAYQLEMPINWCPSCKIGLANEEVVDGKCERCGEVTYKKMQKQWMLRITAYADRLIEDLDKTDYLEKIKTQQINWIGKSTGTNIKFKIKDAAECIEVFTTRADTLFGVTYVVLAPEHPLVESLKPQINNFKKVEEYIQNAKKKSDLERTELQKDKTGVKLEDVVAVNPINGREVEVWVADYVLATYGTGAVMAVPAHDDRDFEFAKKYNIPIEEVIIPKVVDKINPPIDGAETVFRHAIQAIVVNPANKKVLALKWKKFPWTTFITGGVEEGEDPIEAAKREIAEETGYKNVKFIRSLGGPVESHFYASHKKVNRKAHFTALVFELENEEHDNIAESESDIHELSWMSWEELTSDKNLTCAEYEIWLDRFFNDDHSFCDYGILVNSGEFSGLTSSEAKKKITEKLIEINAGDFTVNFKLRDWIFSRQHYWGEPIPIIHCSKCGTVPMNEKDLPLVLPEVEKYQPTDTGESPLAEISEWVNVRCPRCGEPATRETDTMPNWAGSSWYFLRYCDPHNDQSLADKDKLKYWLPVDLYNGGIEHITLHLLYSRFWHKFLYDIGHVPTTEPYQKRISHGIILGADGQKMSKSRGNVINPDEIIEKVGADSLRSYIMFIGPYDMESAWSMAGLSGVARFLNKVWENSKKVVDVSSSEQLTFLINQLTKDVTEDIENYRLNTYIAKLMTFNNFLSKEEKISKEIFKTFVQLLYPTAPHISEEMWQNLNEKESITFSNWPKYDSSIKSIEKDKIAIQVNGKVRDIVEADQDISEEKLKTLVLANEKIKSQLKDKKILKVIVIPHKIISIVTD